MTTLELTFLGIILVVGLVIGYLFTRTKKQHQDTPNTWNEICYVEKGGGDKLTSYFRSEYLTVLPDGKRFMGVELIQRR